jgi:hypothetical protein
MHPQADLAPVKRQTPRPRHPTIGTLRVGAARWRSAHLRIFPPGRKKRPGAAAPLSFVLPQSMPLIGLRPAHAQALVREQASRVLPVRKTLEDANIKNWTRAIAEPFG